MIYSINIDINLSGEEVGFLKKEFLPSRGLLDIYHYKSMHIINALLNKSIIHHRSAYIVQISDVGHKVLDQLDRDKKISNILNE